MSVIPLTLFFSLLLAGLFIVLFAREQRRQRFASLERDSLLPLADEIPVLADDRGTADHDCTNKFGATPAIPQTESPWPVLWERACSRLRTREVASKPASTLPTGNKLLPPCAAGVKHSATPHSISS